ncbi:MAG TPA: DUF202 domain-containing protein [Aldersonia sp.]
MASTGATSSGGRTPEGLQNERTALAWQRLAISVMAGSAALARLTFDRLGPFALISLLALPIGIWVLIESNRRYHHTAGPEGRAAERGGRAHATLAGVIALLGLIQLAAIAVAG